VVVKSYHIKLPDDFDLFQFVRSDYVRAPYLAWTAVEVAELRRECTFVDLRFVESTQ
jgi:hypothetical protein